MDAAFRLDHDDAWNVWTGVAWSINEPSRLRLALLGAMREWDAVRFWTQAGKRLALEPPGEVCEAVLRWAEGSGEPAAAAVLRRWGVRALDGRPTEPEAAAFFAALGVPTTESDSPEGQRVLRDWFNSERPVVVRVAAWRVLAADRDNHSSLRRWLQELAPRNPLAVDLQAAAGVLGELPVRPTGLACLSRMRSERNGKAWDAFASRATHWFMCRGHVFPDRVREQVAMRHAALAAYSRHAEPLEALAERVNPNANDTVNRLETSVLDRALAGGVALALSDPALRRGVFRQADADHIDTKSEHGGLLIFDASKTDTIRQTEDKAPDSTASFFTFRAYEPWRKVHDRAYHAPPTLSWDLCGAWATYHFHAERHANAEHAGPGSGDRRMVEATRVPMVVFTFLDADTLAVHVALPDGVTVQLEPITRP